MKYFLLLAFVFFPSITYGAVTLGATSTANVFSGTSLTWAHDATGDEYLLVSFNSRLGCTGTDITSVTVTYAGVSMSMLKDSTYAGSGECAHMHLYGLSSPTTGSNNIVISWTSSASLVAHAYSFENVGSIGTIAEEIGADSTWDIAVSLTADDMMFGTIGQSQSAPDMTSVNDNVMEDETSPDYIEILSGTETGTGTTTFSGTSGGMAAVLWGVPLLQSTSTPPDSGTTSTSTALDAQNLTASSLLYLISLLTFLLGVLSVLWTIKTFWQ